MLDMILFGLSALAAITGVSSDTQYSMTEEGYAQIASVIGGDYFEVGNNYYLTNASEVEDIYSIYGENRYLQVETKNGGYLIFDKMDFSIVEYESSSISPYYSYDDTFKVFYPMDEEAYHIVYENNTFYSVDSHSGPKNVTNILSSSAGTSNDFYDVYDKKQHPGPTSVVIPNHFYFEKLRFLHGYNPNNICTIIAAQIIFGYYDTFHDDTIVDSKYETGGGTRSDSKDLKDFFGQGTGNASKDTSQSDQRFRDYLIDLAYQATGKEIDIIGAYTPDQVTLVNAYLEKKGISYKLNYIATFSDSQETGKVMEIIKTGINEGRPVIVNGAGHSTVAYAYDDLYVYVHDGNGTIGAVPWRIYAEILTEGLYDTGVIDIEMTGPHVHSDNYYSNYYGEYYCPCGKVFKETNISPEDYGFNQAYYSNEVEKRIEVDGLSILTNRKRCGYIENEYINLSCRRENVTEAYLEYHLDCIVKRIEVNISFWSANEVFVDGSSAGIEVLDSSGNWVNVVNLLDKDIALSTDRTHQNRIIVEFPPNTKSFRFYASNYDIGDRNKGRISIGELRIIHD